MKKSSAFVIAILTCVLLWSPQSVPASTNITETPVLVPARTATSPLPFCEQCGNIVTVTGEVTVTATPGLHTVKTWSSPAVYGINAGEYSITAKCERRSPDCCKVRLVNPHWEVVSLPGVSPDTNQLMASYAPPIGTHIPPGEPVVWGFGCAHPEEGKWQATSHVEVTYDLRTAPSPGYPQGQPLLDESDPPEPQTVTFPGSVKCDLKVVNSEVLISLEDTVIVRQTTIAPPNRREYTGSVR